MGRPCYRLSLSVTQWPGVNGLGRADAGGLGLRPRWRLGMGAVSQQQPCAGAGSDAWARIPDWHERLFTGRRGPGRVICESASRVVRGFFRAGQMAAASVRRNEWPEILQIPCDLPATTCLTRRSSFSVDQEHICVSSCDLEVMLWLAVFACMSR